MSEGALPLVGSLADYRCSGRTDTTAASVGLVVHTLALTGGV